MPLPHSAGANSRLNQTFMRTPPATSGQSCEDHGPWHRSPRAHCPTSDRKRPGPGAPSPCLRHGRSATGNRCRGGAGSAFGGRHVAQLGKGRGELACVPGFERQRPGLLVFGVGGSQRAHLLRLIEGKHGVVVAAQRGLGGAGQGGSVEDVGSPLSLAASRPSASTRRPSASVFWISTEMPLR